MAPLTFLMRPMRWLEAVSTYGAQLTGAPNFAFELCVDRMSPEQRKTIDLSRLQVVVIGAEPVRARTLNRFADAFQVSGFHPSAFMPSYGLAEANVYVSGKRERDGYRSLSIDAGRLENEGLVTPATEGAPERVLVSNGPPPGDIDVRIVDRDTGAVRPDGRTGEIWISGPNVGLGYWRDAERTERTFRSRIAGGEGADWLRSGDIGFLQDGELYVTGRADDLVFVDGRNIHPQDVELTVTDSHDALREDMAAVFTVTGGDEATVVAVAETTWRALEDGDAVKEAVVRAIRVKVSEAHAIGLSDVVLLRRGTLPRTTSGKVQRRQARRLYLSNGLKAW